MTEREKMLAGEPYYAGDEELCALRLEAKKLCYAYNALPPTASEAERAEILGQLIGEADGVPYIKPAFHCDYGCNLTIGKHLYSNYNLMILDCGRVTIGNDVLIGPNVSILTAGHPLDPADRKAELEFAAPIVIGDDVWIGGGAIINPGVTIGAGSVIGSGSVVTKDIPAGVVAVGNPCRVLRPITEADRMARR